MRYGIIGNGEIGKLDILLDKIRLVSDGLEIIISFLKTYPVPTKTQRHDSVQKRLQVASCIPIPISTLQHEH